MHAVRARRKRRTSGWQPSERYPDPAVRVLDPRFNKYRLPLAASSGSPPAPLVRRPGLVRRRRATAVERHPEQPHLRWDEETGAVSVFRKPSNNANGNTRDRQGRLVTCEHRRAASPAPNMTARSPCSADRYEGKRLNSPNDVVVKSDGSIWFTDPPFGILGYYEGDKADAGAADERLPHRRPDRRGHGGGRRHHAAERARASRPTRRSSTSSTRAASRADDPRLRRGRAATKLANGKRVHRRRPAAARRTASAATSTAISGAAGAWARARRRARLQARRRADRPHRAAGALRQPLLRRAQAQPAVHGGEPLALRALREHAGRAGRLTGKKVQVVQP